MHPMTRGFMCSSKRSLVGPILDLAFYRCSSQQNCTILTCLIRRAGGYVVSMVTFILPVMSDIAIGQIWQT